MAKHQTLKTKISYNRVLNKFLFSKFATSPFNSIWLKISMNWHTKSQGPKKKCAHFTRERIHSCSVDTARNKGSFTSIALWSVQSFFSPTVHVYYHNHVDSIQVARIDIGLPFLFLHFFGEYEQKLDIRYVDFWQIVKTRGA